MKQILILLILPILLNAQNNNTVLQTTNSTSNEPLSPLSFNSYKDLPINASQASSRGELDICLEIVKDSNTIIGSYEWSYGFQRVFDDGFRDIYLYLAVKDSKSNMRQVQAVIAVDPEDKVYTLISVNQYVLNSAISAGNSSSFEPITRPLLVPDSSIVPNSLNDIYKAFSNNFDQLSQTQIQQDSDLSALQLDIAKLYLMIKNHQISAVFWKKWSQFSTAYIIFYLSKDGSNDVWSIYGVVDNLKKVHYIISVNQIDTSSVGKRRR